jgi:DNA-binding CsgD family transcriptional regulator
MPMAPESHGPLSSDDARLLETLQRLLAIRSPKLRPTLNEASTLVAEAVGADKVDVFLHEADTDSLVALGTSATPLGRKQHALGLDRFPRTNAGPLTRVFETGELYATGHADQDPTQPRGVIEGLGVRSQIDVALELHGQRHGVLAVVCQEPERFTARDQHFLETVAAWVSLLVDRARLVERYASEAATQARRAAGDELARLTRRQQEVAACVAEGLSNEEIGERLMLVPGTVANHLEDIFRRIRIRNRTALATWAVEHGLYRSAPKDE